MAKRLGSVWEKYFIESIITNDSGLYIEGERGTVYNGTRKSDTRNWTSDLLCGW